MQRLFPFPRRVQCPVSRGCRTTSRVRFLSSSRSTVASALRPAHTQLGARRRCSRPAWWPGAGRAEASTVSAPPRTAGSLRGGGTRPVLVCARPWPSAPLPPFLWPSVPPSRLLMRRATRRSAPARSLRAHLCAEPCWTCVAQHSCVRGRGVRGSYARSGRPAWAGRRGYAPQAGAGADRGAWERFRLLRRLWARAHTRGAAERRAVGVRGPPEES